MNVDYDRVAPRYRARYSHADYAEVESAVRAFAADAADVLEVGCGTGHWVARFASTARRSVGVDPSTGMLRRADDELKGRCLVRGVAEALPFPDDTFDFVFAINALHHFADPATAWTEVARVLRPGGRCATVGLDPSTGADQWYVYDYFPRTLALDRRRYPSSPRIRAWLEASGFHEISTSVAQHIPAREPARAYVESPAFHRHVTSQLSLLTDEEFESGLAAIWRDIRRGEEAGTPAVLSADLRLYMTTGQLPA